MQTKESIEALIKNVYYKNGLFNLLEKGGEFYIQMEYLDRCVITGLEEVQKTRKWLISKHATNSEVVQTMLKCALTSAEHQVIEKFTYKGKRIFGPHFDIEELVRIAEKTDERA